MDGYTARMPTRRIPARAAAIAVALAAALMLAPSPTAQSGSTAQSTPPRLKVFISVDMEGLSGVAEAADVNPTGRDYEHFRTIMAAETNAAIAGAVRAGATMVVVRDSHGGKMNLRPGDLTSPRARLIRGANTGPKNMMEGIDETFAAAVFIGYHAKAGTPNAVLAHTSNGNVIDFSINGVSLPEAGYNALVAGLYKVPVVFAAGDEAFVTQARALLGDIEVLSTKSNIGGAVGGLTPASSEQLIRVGVERHAHRPRRSHIHAQRLAGDPQRVQRDEVTRPSRRITGGWEARRRGART
jgi:D-amino peptidase